MVDSYLSRYYPSDEIHAKYQRTFFIQERGGGGAVRENIIFAGPEMHMQKYLSSMCIVPL